MKTLLHYIFLSHWERKLISVVLSVIVWLIVNHSLSISKTVESVAVRVINIPKGMTVEGLQSNGLLNTPITITLHGNKNSLSDLSGTDLEVVIDATDKSGKWSPAITKKNLVFLNPEIDLSNANIRVYPCRLSVYLTRLITDKIPVVVTSPIGEAPRDYQFLDVWPYHLYLTVSASEDIVKQLKAEGLRLTFNMGNISHDEIDAVYQNAQMAKSGEVSFAVPDEWKHVVVPQISSQPILIDDPLAKFLRIDFIRNDLHPLAKSIPITLFYPTESSVVLNPENYTLQTNGIIQQFHGIPMIRKSLYAKGVSKLFVKLVQEMVQIAVIVSPKNERKSLDWSVQFINAKALEDRYVSILMSEREHEIELVQTKKFEEHLRNRFRSYMNRFQLFKADQVHFELNAEIQGNTIRVEESL
jgi:hypothetical protein